jgi:glycosyltransferase involved in cell wall biosynthesis
MNVALINDFLPQTGIGNYAFSLFAELQKKIDCEMLFLDCCNEMKKDVPKLKRISTPVRFPILNKSLNNYFLFPGKIPDGYSLYHVSNQYLSNIALKKNPCIISCMDIIPIAFDKGYNPIVSFFWKQQMQHLNKSEKITTISDFTKSELERVFNIAPEKIQTIHLGVDLKLFLPRQKEIARVQLGLPKEGIFFLNVGSEEKRKNIETLFRAFALVLKQYPRAKLLRVGEQKKESIELASKLGIMGNIEYFSGVSGQRLAMMYNAADALVFSSVYEGFGLPVLEAMASGLPVITNKRSSIPEITGNAGLFCENPFDEFELREKMLKVLDDNIQRKLSSYGAQRAKDYSWENCAKKTIELYEAVSK